ncbi:hypothetical protein KB893_003290 [Coralloluteibacterium stylophorae]|uniref:Glycoamylase-like domain-containing protein n=1 Tax=Coralloluteibacterium stylophorae TaxID=1776034 RepID=A0A8J7VT52_9GAMM|nr:hypothetical protein [Coralloluteibacterium stylophorae]
MHRLAATVLASALAVLAAGCATPALEPRQDEVADTERPPLPPLFEDLQERTFRYFWDTANPDNGLVPDRYPYDEPFSSVAAVGFALTAYAIGAEHGWVSREQARERTLTTLRFLHDAPMGPEESGTAGHKGFYYHFLHLDSGTRYDSWVELSSVDTALLLGGVLFAQSYYGGDGADEAEIRELAEAIYRRVDWSFLQERPPLISMGWFPESGTIANDWQGYNEAMLVYLLALASPTHPIAPEAWQAWTRTYERSWGLYEDQQHLGFGPHFGHQYSHVWVDFRGIRDRYMRERGFDYFENSRRATYAQRAYAIDNPMRWQGYGENIWGLTASDGPQVATETYQGETREFRHYSARGGIGFPDEFDDGTIAPTAAAASLPFAPEIVIPAVQEMHDLYGDQIYADYGFLDSFNRSFRYDNVELKTGQIIPGFGWVASQYIGIDQGPILAMIENYRDDFVWEVMRNNPHIRTGLVRAGFRGGWLEPVNAPQAPDTAPDPHVPAPRND